MNKIDQILDTLYHSYNGHPNPLAITEAKVSLRTLLEEVIGEDEAKAKKTADTAVDRRLVYPVGVNPAAIKARNDLRAEQREALGKLFEK